VTIWPGYQLDPKTRALLSYASKLTETPSLVGREDTELLQRAGWNEQAIWEITLNAV
jgi:alkylhydroperoxidase family enzyme